MRGLARSLPDFQPLGVTAAAVVVVGVVVGSISWAVEHASYDTWGGVLVAGALIAAGIAITVRLSRHETDERMRRLVVIAFVLKMASVIARWAVSFGVYDGSSDATSYHRAGVALFEAFRDGNFSAGEGELVGTGFIQRLTGAIYAVTGPTEIGGYFVYSFLGFWGLYFFYRAFCIACPEGDRYRYALLVFLLPSLLFWPSSIGKEAWMTFTLGLASYGAARLLSHHRHGFLLLALGGGGTALVRPHVSVILGASIFAAFLLRRAPKDHSITSPLAKLTGIVVLGCALVLVVGQTEKLFGLDDFSQDSVREVLEQAQTGTDEAGSAFENEDTDLSVTRFPDAFVSVLFRPFPYEAHNAQALIASLEGAVLLALLVVSWRRVVGAIRSVLRTPYVVVCCCYTVLFVFGFSSFSNFGIVTRQRVQVLPFVLVLLALPPFRPQHRGWRELLYDDRRTDVDRPAAVAP
jgi:hypothetical protein